MSQRDQITVVIDADLDKLRRDLAQARKQFAQFANEAKRANAAAQRAGDRAATRGNELGRSGHAKGSSSAKEPTSKSLADDIVDRLFRAFTTGGVAYKATGGLARTQTPLTLAVKTVIITGAALTGAFAPELLESLLEAKNVPAEGKRSVEEISKDLEFKRKLAKEDLRAFEKLGLNDQNFPLIKETLDELARLERELAKAIKEATTPSLDDLGQPLPDDRIRPDGLRGSFLDFGGGDSSFADLRLDRAEDSLSGFGERLAELPGAFAQATQGAGRFQSQTETLIGGLLETNTLFGEQGGLLGELDAALPELGRAFATLFEEAAGGGRGLERVVEGLGQSLLDAFQGAAFEGKSFRAVLKGIIDDILVISQLPGQGGGGSLFGDLLGGIFGGLFGGGGGAQFGGGLNLGVFAKGAAFEPGGVMARNIQRFARGGIVDTPEAFAFARGLGIMGEDGPEAILPLTRTSDGELGVRASMPRLPELPPPAPAGPVFVINAPGADREGLREVMALIRRLQGQIVSVSRSITPIAINAVLDNRRRGGNIARAFGAR